MRLFLTLLVAGVISLLIGLVASAIAVLIPCQGEGLVCRLDEAIGAYAVLIWTVLGPLIFGVILIVARNRVTLASGMILLLAPPVVFLFVVMIESWQTIGMEPYKNMRMVMVMFVPVALTVVAQWLILTSAFGRNLAVPLEVVANPPNRPAADAGEDGMPDHDPSKSPGGLPPFPTE